MLVQLHLVLRTFKLQINISAARKHIHKGPDDGLANHHPVNCMKLRDHHMTDLTIPSALVLSSDEYHTIHPFSMLFGKN